MSSNNNNNLKAELQQEIVPSTIHGHSFILFAYNKLR